MYYSKTGRLHVCVPYMYINVIFVSQLNLQCISHTGNFEVIQLQHVGGQLFIKIKANQVIE